MQAITDLCEMLKSFFTKKTSTSITPCSIIDESKVIPENNTNDMTDTTHMTDMTDMTDMADMADLNTSLNPMELEGLTPFRQVEMPRIPELLAQQPLDDTAMDTDTPHLDADIHEERQDVELSPLALPFALPFAHAAMEENDLD